LIQNRQNSLFNIDSLRKIVEKLIFSDKIEIMTNSWPLYFIFDMLLNSGFSFSESKLMN